MRKLYPILLLIAAFAAIPLLGYFGKQLSDRGASGWTFGLAIILVGLEWTLLTLFVAACSRDKGDQE